MEKQYALNNHGLLFQISVGGAIQKRFYSDIPDRHSMIFDNCSEFVLTVESGGHTEVFYDKAFTLERVAEETNRLGFYYTGEMADLCVTYENDGRTVHKELTINAKKEFRLLQLQSDVLYTESRITRGGEGQPIFADNCFFAGIEYPVAVNERIRNCLVLHQYPWLAMQTGDSHTFPRIVYGFQSVSSIEETFRSYIYDYTPIKYATAPSIFNEWAAHDELGSGPELTEALVEKQLDKLEEMKEASGFAFDYYTMDAFWFEENTPYTEFKKRTWPNGPNRIIDRMRRQDMKFGLWFDVNSDLLKLTDAACQNRYNCQFKKCLSDPEYLALLEHGILYNIEKYDVRMLKLDFADFDCADPSHDWHAEGGLASKEPAVRGLIHVLERVRKVQPDMMIMAYNGFTTNLDWLVSIDSIRKGYAISPWWAFFVEYVYCGDPRPSEIPAASLRHSVDWYLDAMVRSFYDSLLPLPVIDDCGIMVGNADTIYFLGRSEWRDGWMLSMSRGGKKVHFYGDLTLLSREDFIFMKASSQMFEKLRRNDGSYKTRLILGNAALGQPYGYANSNGSDGYLTLVNPTAEAQPVTILLDEWAKSTRQQVRKFYYEGGITDKAWELIGSALSVTLQPEEVVVYEWRADKAPAKISGVLYIPPHSSLCADMSAVSGEWLTVRFYNEDGSPNRSYAPLPKDFEISGGIGASGIKTQIWSGLSWNVYPLTGDRLIHFRNNSGIEIKLSWDIKTETDNLYEERRW